MAHYTYAPLNEERNEIRLLVIQHDPWTAPLQCSLRVVSLDDQPVYRALSYVWGNINPQTEILLENGTISVNPNLAAAVRRLRASTIERQPLEIWIDAICVDQENIPERGYSVSLMKKIYMGCIEVIAWLGEIEPMASALPQANMSNDAQDQDLRDSHDIGCDCLESAWEGLPEEVSGTLLPAQIQSSVQVLRRLGTARNCSDLQLCRVFKDQYQMIAFRKFMRFMGGNVWFTRVWTLQEAILPPMIQLCIGQIQFSFDILHDLVGVVGNHQRDGCCGALPYIFILSGRALTHVSEIAWARSVCQAGQPFENLFALRAFFVGRKASLDVDLIYGVLGLCQNEFVPRYDRSVEDVYTDMSKSFLQVASSCDCYAFSMFVYAAIKSRYSHLPSWVMDWTSLEVGSPCDSRDHWYKIQSDPDHTASMTGSHQVRLKFNGETLVLRGFILDKIIGIGDECSCLGEGTYRYTDRYMASAHEWRKLVLMRHEPDGLYKLPSGYSRACQNWATVWFKTLCQNRRLCRATPELNSGLSILTSEEIETVLADSRFDPSNIFILRWEPQYLNHPNTRQASQLLARMANPDLYIQALYAAYVTLHEQRMFLTQQGYVGIGNRNIAPNDLIFLSETCGRPLILRPNGNSVSRSGRQTYKIVSACYLEGFMEGPDEPTSIACEEFWIE